MVRIFDPCAERRSPALHVEFDERFPTRVGLELSGPDEPLIYEITFNESVSRHGARVVTKRDSVLVKLPEECFPTHARITYRLPSKGDEFVTVLQFSSAVYSWRDSE